MRTHNAVTPYQLQIVLASPAKRALKSNVMEIFWRRKIGYLTFWDLKTNIVHSIETYCMLFVFLNFTSNGWLLILLRALIGLTLCRCQLIVLVVLPHVLEVSQLSAV